jgi:hypothetical protein
VGLETKKLHASVAAFKHLLEKVCQLNDKVIAASPS